MKIGFVGLGGIGTRMVLRLVEAGHDTTVYRRGAGLDEVLAAGATADADYRSLAASSDLLILCVYDDAQVRDILIDNGALAAMRSGTVVALHTTGSPELARHLGEIAPDGVSVIDTTFSGGPNDVTAGQLTVMVGGEPDAIEAARPALSAYTSRIFHVGPLGHGQMVKLLNNLLFATNLMYSVELLRLGRQLGFDTTTVAEVVQVCSGASYTMNLFKGAEPESMLVNARHYMEKDVATALHTAAELGIDVSAFSPTAAYFAKPTER